MSPGRSCDGGPRRAVQNQVFWCTECHRKTVPYRIRPPAVRDTSAERFGTTEVPVQFAVTDNILTQNRLKVLPVPICEQAKSSSACLPPLEWLCRRKVGLSASGNFHWNMP